MQNCVGEVLLLGIFAVTAYRDWKEQMICVYVPLAAGIAGLVFHLMLPTQNFSGILAECGVVFNGAYADCSGGVVWTHCEA